MNVTEVYTLRDELAEVPTDYNIWVTVEGEVISLTVEGTNIWIGVEIADGKLRGLFGPEAEVVDVGRGIIIAEEITASSAEGFD